MTEHAYVHIPFCKSKCNYCSFTSFTALDCVEDYVSALLREISMRCKGEKLKTLYFGGGTPSLLSIKNVEKILGKFSFDDLAEITFEANPNDLTLGYLLELKDLGVNRLSLGAQSFKDDVLKLCARRHTSSEIAKAYAFARDAEFKNISLDLIYGLPKQNFADDLARALELEPEHMSLYGLKIESGTKFADMPRSFFPDNDAQADDYLFAAKILAQSGYEHYEVSNFAKDGMYSRHNMNCWGNNFYYGFGVAAHGYENGLRYANTADLSEYLNDNFTADMKTLSEQEKLEEELFLGFRRRAGIDVGQVNRKFEIDFDKKYNDILKKYLQSGHILKTEVGYGLSLYGVMLSNDILCEFLA